ncbi:hypothetical protein B296_00013867 [Ensete ventricosum]|uniref:Uncharacterized protein n=1 Tax=Ensete ventricosum TaxID=4639 RepID=A0A426YB57_ENSVE|nr:hypothetical protein B296_00013867 [Ensete ventricosum]
MFFLYYYLLPSRCPSLIAANIWSKKESITSQPSAVAAQPSRSTSLAPAAFILAALIAGCTSSPRSFVALLPSLWQPHRIFLLYYCPTKVFLQFRQWRSARLPDICCFLFRSIGFHYLAVDFSTDVAAIAASSIIASQPSK